MVLHAERRKIIAGQSLVAAVEHTGFPAASTPWIAGTA
jgi:hypothetical protein